MPPLPEWAKTLIIALVSSFFTVSLMEPIKAVIHQRIRKRAIRKCVYQEIVENYQHLRAQVSMATDDPRARSGIGIRFAMGFKKISFELAQGDPVTYYSLGDELYWIELLYSGMQQVVEGSFDDDDQRLRNAGYHAHSVLSDIKNRHFSKNLMFHVSSKSLQEHFREELPKIPYIDVKPPSLLKRLQRRFD
jgi:hypothetical protein